MSLSHRLNTLVNEYGGISDTEVLEALHDSQLSPKELTGVVESFVEEVNTKFGLGILDIRRYVEDNLYIDPQLSEDDFVYEPIDLDDEDDDDDDYVDFDDDEDDED